VSTPSARLSEMLPVHFSELYLAQFCDAARRTHSYATQRSETRVRARARTHACDAEPGEIPHASRVRACARARACMRVTVMQLHERQPKA